ncbi:ribokinase [Streptomyces sp. NPDC051016]|uniref:ribokinase n=1 Tax=Streptomyces sp. NPDC051016 TaxID=3365638 RepID=UPI0037B3DEFE
MNDEMAKSEILVVGSINLDILLFQDRLPARGETYPARELREEFGGKGANQAVQAAKLGQRVRFIGAIGRDRRGQDCRGNLERFGIDCYLQEVDRPTGLGVNNILANGELHATVALGANAALTSEWIESHKALFDQAAYVLLQNEISPEANAIALLLAKDSGSRVIYNAAPAIPSDLSIMSSAAYLVVNEEEAKAYAGGEGTSPGSMEDTVAQLRNHCSRVIVTRGADDTLVCVDSEIRHVPVAAVNPVDTTGAGDAFVGTLASALNSGRSDLDATVLASRLASEATKGIGAQGAMADSWE